VADETVKIPKPTADQELALSRAGVGNHRLVFNKTARKWEVKKNENVNEQDITYDKWRGGEKDYKAPARAKGEQLPSDVRERVDAGDPFGALINKYGLQVVTDPVRKTTSLEGFTIDPKTGQRGQDTVPFYLYLDSNNTIQVSEDYDKVKKSALDDLRKTGQINALFQDLYNRKAISKATFEKKDIAAADFNAALAGVITDYSISAINNRQFGISTEAPNFLGFLQGIPTAGPSEADLPRREFQDIGKAELNAFIDKIYLETIGRKPSEEQRKAKLQELNNIVKKGVLSTRKVVGGEVQYRTKGGFNQEREALKLEEQLKQENPLEYERRQAFGFMDELSKILGGGM
jgi:hypothetical protein